MKIRLQTVLTLGLFFFLAPSMNAQSCLTRDDISAMLARVDSAQQVKPNQKLEKQLLLLATRQQELLQEFVQEEKKQDSVKNRLHELNRKNTEKFCAILKEFGWPTTELVEREGVLAAFHLLKNSAPFEMQRDLLPMIVAAVKKDKEQRPEFAGLYDRLRVSVGMKQLFGTQAASINGFLVLYPIEDEARVDDRRKQFGLKTLEESLRTMERQYRTPVVRSRKVPDSNLSSGLKQSLSNAINSTSLDTATVEENDIVRVNTNLVSLNVTVFSTKSQTLVGDLTRNDFKVYENGQEETISFFGATNVPFDLVLLIDLSGSTLGKRELIRESTKNFIESARPTDRIAIVTFSNEINLLSPLTDNRSNLLSSVTGMTGGGGSNVWDAVKFTLDRVIGPPSLERRRAIILMSDGVDGNLIYSGGQGGSTITFADLIEGIRQTDTLVIPIYLDTESDQPNSSTRKISYENARKTLALLAEESGGSYYKARKVSDLNGVYEQVINDLGKVYSLGYKPTNNLRDGTWRRVEIKIANRSDLLPRSRPGYYAR